jgi:hypothetical protein
LGYQWRFFGTNVPGATGTNYTIDPVSTNNVGSYQVVVANSYGAATSAPPAWLTNLFPPSITLQPSNTTVVQNGTAQFGVTATGDSPLGYQWFFNVTNILTNAINSLLSITNAQTNNTGNYTVVVTNSIGAVTSAPATLTVNFSPIITVQPTDQTVAAGATVTFVVVAVGSPSPTYQWLFNSNNIPFATNFVYSKGNVRTSDAGQYQVIAYNSFGSYPSDPFTLRVLVSTTITPSRIVSNRFSLSYPTVSGQNYIVQYKNLLNASNWSTLTNVAGTGGTVTNSDSVTNSRFYRITIQ